MIQIRQIDKRNEKRIIFLINSDRSKKIISLEKGKNWMESFHSVVDRISEMEDLSIPKKDLFISFDFVGKTTDIHLWNTVGTHKGESDNLISCTHAFVDWINKFPSEETEKIWVG